MSAWLPCECSLNIIDGDTLLRVADEIDKQQCRRLIHLDLTGNPISAQSQPEIQQRYSRFATSVVAPRLFPS